MWDWDSGRSVVARDKTGGRGEVWVVGEMLRERREGRLEMGIFSKCLNIRVQSLFPQGFLHVSSGSAALSAFSFIVETKSCWSTRSTPQRLSPTPSSLKVTDATV